VRASVVGSLHGAHGAGAVYHGGRDGIATGGAGGHGGGSNLVSQVERHVFLGAHGLRAGGGGDEGQDDGGKMGVTHGEVLQNF
jgi:hypothetical protein